MSTKGSSMFFSYAGPLNYAELALRSRIERAKQLGATGDRGASAIEWVIITAITIVIVGAVGTLIFNKLNAKANNLNLDVGPQGP